jgi:hypothetical protein
MAISDRIFGRIILWQVLICAQEMDGSSGHSEVHSADAV